MRNCDHSDPRGGFPPAEPEVRELGPAVVRMHPGRGAGHLEVCDLYLRLLEGNTTKYIRRTDL